MATVPESLDFIFVLKALESPQKWNWSLNLTEKIF